MKPIYTQTFTLNDLVVDPFGRLKLSALLFYAQEIAGQHSALLGADYDTLASKKLFWAITRNRVQVTYALFYEELLSRFRDSSLPTQETLVQETMKKLSYTKASLQSSLESMAFLF